MKKRQWSKIKKLDDDLKLFMRTKVRKVAILIIT